MAALDVSRLDLGTFADIVAGSGTIVVVIGSITGLFVALLAATAWIRLPKPPHWLLAGVLWLMSSLTIGALVSGVLVTVIDGLLEIPTAPPLGALVTRAIAISVFTAIGGALFLAIPYLPILLLWERVAARVGWLERTHTGIVVSGMLLAIPGTLIAAVLATPTPYHTIDVTSRLSEMSMLGAQIAVCIFVPRLLLPRLGPGAFATSG